MLAESTATAFEGFGLTLPFPHRKPTLLSSSYKEESLVPAAVPVRDELADDGLVDAVLAGDESSFEVLFSRHSRRIFTIARHFFRQQDTVEDIVQETFTKAYVSLASYRRGASFAHWLARIAVNNCYDELRRRQKRSESLFTELSDDDGVWLETTLAPFSFDLHLKDQDQARAVEITDLLLAKLPPEDRLVLILLHAEELSVREIAQLTGWSEAKVKIRAFRARQVARRAIKRLLASKPSPQVVRQ
ncbi:MAG: sigma-70 family RNA polymerase sigma factor [Acidobacteriota bacterium]